MKFKILKKQIRKLKSTAKKKGKKTCFLISNTSKKFNKPFYLTPLRESKKSLYFGAVVFGNKIAEEIAKEVDGKVNYVYTDVEKKIRNKNDYILTNIDRCVRENIHKSIVKIYKSNDITVNSVESLVNDYFSNDTRGVSGKKILIIGVGNIGSKIALRLVETGANISLFRRNKLKLKTIKNALNLIKPLLTKASCKMVDVKNINLINYDVIIGCSNSEFRISNKRINFSKKQLIIDVGKGVFGEKIVNSLKKINKLILRVDIETMLSSYIDSTIDTESFFKNRFSKKYKSFNLIKKGILGEKGDIVVDNIEKPKEIIGVCNNDGTLMNINNKKINYYKSLIIKYGKK
tara:strand:+ start:313 stop:1353 length:1041 start_codon:yes stop_codon:yes gene_type:complete